MCLARTSQDQVFLLEGGGVSKRKKTNSCILRVLQVFTSASTMVLNTFVCDDAVVEEASYLRADYSISCESGWHTVFKGYAILMIMVRAVGCPCWRMEHILPVFCLYSIRAEFRRGQRISFEVELRF